MPIHWLPWNAAAFDRARVVGKPILLSIATTWSGSCTEMEQGYGDPRVVALVNEGFVPIRVDADRRPDIGSRYNLGGWPTTAFLTADGELLGGGTFVESRRLPDVLRQVSEAFASKRQTLTAPPPGVPTVDALMQGASSAALQARVLDAFDARIGAFGSEPCFPHTAPVRFALALVRETDPMSAHARDVAITALDAMGWGDLYDEVDGGFFRFANGPGWQHPHHEKLLDVNAAMLAVYVEAFETLRLDRYRERALDILRYLQTWLADPVEGGWAASQREDPTYYVARERTTLPPPPIDLTLYADWNAAAVSATLHAARVFGDEGLREFAIRSLERTLLHSYRPGAGVAHYVDGADETRGLLDDQVAMAAAHLDAYEATGNIVYEMMAEELAWFALRAMWDPDGAGFFDRALDPAGLDVGLLRRPLKPFVGNCEAARLLRRLAASSGEPSFADRAAQTLEAIAPLAPGQGPLAAHYLLALRESAAR